MQDNTDFERAQHRLAFKWILMKVIVLKMFNKLNKWPKTLFIVF